MVHRSVFFVIFSGFTYNACSTRHTSESNRPTSRYFELIYSAWQWIWTVIQRCTSQSCYSTSAHLLFAASSYKLDFPAKLSTINDTHALSYFSKWWCTFLGKKKKGRKIKEVLGEIHIKLWFKIILLFGFNYFFKKTKSII